MCGAVSPFPQTPSWRGVQLKRSTGATLPSDDMKCWMRSECLKLERNWLCIISWTERCYGNSQETRSTDKINYE
jgi:hypothetical protein